MIGGGGGGGDGGGNGNGTNGDCDVVVAGFFPPFPSHPLHSPPLLPPPTSPPPTPLSPPLVSSYPSFSPFISQLLVLSACSFMTFFPHMRPNDPCFIG